MLLNLSCSLTNLRLWRSLSAGVIVSMDVRMNQRERLIFVGLFLAKFTKQALDHLGFRSYSEAYNAIAFALGGKPTSLKNYQQEFDPLFPTTRKGWGNRAVREHTRKMLERFGGLSFEEFSARLSSLLLLAEKPPEMPQDLLQVSTLAKDSFVSESVSKRLVTGVSAERFFESEFPSIDEFKGHELTNVTLFGCGFDFRIQPPSRRPFLAAEVKGLYEKAGEIMLTAKERRVAEYLGDRYFLCVVRNFADSPSLSIFRNPLNEGLRFVRRERQQAVETWHARIVA
jgi:hypothetical protein